MTEPNRQSGENEERIIEIEIERLRPFKEHPFQVKDRMSLSIKNQWFDDKNRAYIYFSIEDIMELLNCGRNKAIKSMRELDDETGIGLIEKRRQGFGKVNVIYVKTFMPEKTDEKKFGEELKKFKKQTSVENEESTEVYNSNFMKSQNQTSRSPENKLQEVYISNPTVT